MGGEAVRDTRAPRGGFVDPRVRGSLADDLGVQLLSAAVRLLMDADDQMAWRRLVAVTPGLGTVRLKAILSAGEATYLRNLRNVAEADGVSRLPQSAGQDQLERFAGNDEVAAAELVDLLADSLGLVVDMTQVDVLRSDGDVAAPAEWLQRLIDLDETAEVASSSRRFCSRERKRSTSSVSSREMGISNLDLTEAWVLASRLSRAPAHRRKRALRSFTR
jgi:hypothetical protein